MGRNLESRKRKRDEVSDTESDESSNSLKDVFITPREIKREIKTPKREIKTPQREIGVETPIKKEHKSPKKEVGTSFNIKKEISNTESSDDSSKSGTYKVSNKIKTKDHSDSGSESEELANSFRIQMLKEEKNRVLSKTKHKHKSRKSDKKHKEQFESEDVDQISVRKGDRNKEHEKSSDFESEFNSSSTSRNSILKHNIHSSKEPKYFKESAGSESDSGISHINAPKVQMKEINKQSGIVVGKSKSSNERTEDLSEESSDFSLEEQRQEDERVVKKIGEKIQQNKINVLQNINIGKNPMEQLKSLYPNLRRANRNVDINIANSDIYLLKIPKTIDPNILLNIDINPSQVNKFKAGKTKYVLESTDTPADTKLLILGDHCEIVNIQSNIFLKKYLKPVKIPEIEVPENTNVPLPNNLKERHPLFGANFEDKVELSQEIREKLDLAIVNKFSEEQTRSKSKKKKKKRKSEHEDEVIFDLLLSNSSSSKRKKKIKIENVDDTAYLNSSDHNASEEPTRSKSKKKKEKRKGENEDEVIFDLLLSNSSSSKRKKKIKVENVDDTTYLNSSDHNASESLIENILGELKTEVLTDESMRKRKKSKKAKKE